MSFTMPSCADGSWRAPSLSVAVDEVRRDCTAPSPANEYVTARIRATGLVYGLGYEVRGTVLGETVNNLPPFGTTVDRAVTLSPAPDQRSGAGPPTPFPSSAFTATVQLVGEPADDWFTRDERSAGVPVAVPACQPGSSAGPAPASPWSRRRPVLPTR